MFTVHRISSPKYFFHHNTFSPDMQPKQIAVYRIAAAIDCRAGACSRRQKMFHFSKENNKIVPAARHFAIQNARREQAPALHQSNKKKRAGVTRPLKGEINR
jgi:hypothetical protein